MSQGQDDAKDDSEPARGQEEKTREVRRGRDSRITARPAAELGAMAEGDVPEGDVLGGVSTESGKRTRFEVQAARRAVAAANGALEPPSAEEVLFTVLELNRTVSVEMQDDAIVRGYIQALRVLFPRRRFAVRLLSPEGGALTLEHATGTLTDLAREHIVLSQEAIERHELSRQEIRDVGGDVTRHYQSVFEEAGLGFDIPLVPRSVTIGVMNVEYEPALSAAAFDRSLIVPLAVQLGAALWNARLLRESNYLRDNLGKLLDHANAPIVVIGRERDLRVVNRAFLALTQMSREELLGRDFLQLLPETERARMLPVFIRALRGESTSNFEVAVQRADGGRSRIVVNTASILATDGEVEGVIAIGRDLTEVRELEEQIIQAEKLATLGQLAAGVVHELNNPLTSISVYAEYLLRKGQRSEYDASDLEKVRRIVESADRILKFTHDLVTYARPSSEQPSFVRIGDVLEQSLLFCEHVIGETRADVVKQYDDPRAMVYAVKGQLHQVFINLITNACHALPSEAGQLVLTTTLDAEEHLLITIADNGCGIPEDQRVKIFEPFFSTKGEGRGTGLGLSIVRNIVRQHGGTIEVGVGVAGTGTVFQIRLPARTGVSTAQD